MLIKKIKLLLLFVWIVCVINVSLVTGEEPSEPRSPSEVPNPVPRDIEPVPRADVPVPMSPSKEDVWNIVCLPKLKEILGCSLLLELLGRLDSEPGVIYVFVYQCEDKIYENLYYLDTSDGKRRIFRFGVDKQCNLIKCPFWETSEGVRFKWFSEVKKEVGKVSYKIFTGSVGKWFGLADDNGSLWLTVVEREFDWSYSVQSQDRIDDLNKQIILNEKENFDCLKSDQVEKIWNKHIAETELIGRFNEEARLKRKGLKALSKYAQRRKQKRALKKQAEAFAKRRLMGSAVYKWKRARDVKIEMRKNSLPYALKTLKYKLLTLAETLAPVREIEEGDVMSRAEVEKMRRRD
jgi:hypothetical protein